MRQSDDFRAAYVRSLKFGLSLDLHTYFEWASSEGSDEPARFWAFAVRICDMDQNLIVTCATRIKKYSWGSIIVFWHSCSLNFDFIEKKKTHYFVISHQNFMIVSLIVFHIWLFDAYLSHVARKYVIRWGTRKQLRLCCSLETKPGFLASWPI